VGVVDHLDDEQRELMARYWWGRAQVIRPGFAHLGMEVAA
jgi:hypothetical protein